MACFRYVIVHILHKGDNKDGDDDNNDDDDDNNNNNIKPWEVLILHWFLEYSIKLINYY